MAHLIHLLTYCLTFRIVLGHLTYLVNYLISELREFT